MQVLIIKHSSQIFLCLVVNAEFQLSMYNVREAAELLVLELMANATSSFAYIVSLTTIDRSTGE